MGACTSAQWRSANQVQRRGVKPPPRPRSVCPRSSRRQSAAACSRGGFRSPRPQNTRRTQKALGVFCVFCGSPPRFGRVLRFKTSVVAASAERTDDPPLAGRSRLRRRRQSQNESDLVLIRFATRAGPRHASPFILVIRLRLANRMLFRRTRGGAVAPPIHAKTHSQTPT